MLGVKFAGDEVRALDLLQGAYRARDGRMAKADALRSVQLSLIADLRNGRLSIKTRSGGSWFRITRGSGRDLSSKAIRDYKPK
jgi:hypothetical protein